MPKDHQTGINDQSHLLSPLYTLLPEQESGYSISKQAPRRVHSRIIYTFSYKYGLEDPPLHQDMHMHLLASFLYRQRDSDFFTFNLDHYSQRQRLYPAGLVHLRLTSFGAQTKRNEME
jgi:hypothetical protein